MITIYTDGAAKGNPGPGGYGTVLLYKDLKKELSDGYRLTTNNRMELLAVIRGLEALKVGGIPVTIYSDSKYVVDAVEKGWIWSWQKKGFKDKKNVDLWKQYIPLHMKYKPKFVWVKGHAGNPMNERCDQLAVAASEQRNLKIDQAYENEKNNSAGLFLK
ncbi:ribonuclease HI [Belliella sp. DSM 111904]|uniref:ribonuclease H n=1 Tax=Belliella filtrata TaxID=2923435 RepID=A0ABS9UX78_9BACT|nr:ribonuclease HI [Belliella filtrata]MCH7408781.1 ribonuclease HI [Belliella filtrata]